MYCYKCGTFNDDNAFRCVKCSTVIQKMPATGIPARQDNTATILLVVIGGIVGFMMVISIIGILAAIAIPQFAAYRTRAYNAQAYSEIQTICEAANSFLSEHPDGIIALDDLTEMGISIPPEIEITIEDGTREYFSVSARHKNGNKVYVADENCDIQSINP